MALRHYPSRAPRLALISSDLLFQVFPCPSCERIRSAVAGLKLTEFGRILQYSHVITIFGVGELPMLRFATAAAVCLVVPVALSTLTDPTLAQSSAQQLTIISPRPVPTPIPPRAGPAPLLGVGLPLFGGVLGVLIFIRGYWRKQ